MTNTTKTAMIALIIMSAAMMSGCLDGSDTAKEDVTIERMVQLEAILTDPEISEEEKIAAYTLAHEAITGEKIELNSEVNVTPTEGIERKIVGVTVRQGDTGIVTGVGEVIVLIQGGKDYNTLKEIKVLVNNISLGTYPAEYQTEYKIDCDIIGKWNVRVDGAFTDGTTQTLINTSGFELRELKDVPNAGALGERYIEPSNGMSREDAKKFCEENGIIWGCDDNPTSKPTLTSTKVTPTVMPTVVATPEPEPELPIYYQKEIEMIICRAQWDKSVIALTCARIPYEGIENVKIYVGSDMVAIIEPVDTSNIRYTRSEFNYPMLINLPDGISNTGEITMTISVFDLSLGVEDGEYPISVLVHTPPMRYEEKFNTYTVWNP